MSLLIKKIQTRGIITIIFLFTISISAYSSEDVYCGKYKSVKSKFKISFDLTDCGLKNLSVNKIKIDTTSITWRYLDGYGNTQLFEIDFNDDKYTYNIKFFIIEIERGFFWVAGYYIKYNSKDDDDMMVLEKQILELKWEPLEKCLCR